MRAGIVNIKKNLKLQIFVGLAILLFFFKLFFYSAGSVTAEIVNEFLIVLTVAALILYLVDSVRSKTVNPLSLVMNVGILNAVLFFLITFSDSILSGILGANGSTGNGIIDTLISFMYVFVIIGSVSYIFLVFRELFFLKQKKNVSTYFNTMTIFFVLASLSALVGDTHELFYIRDTFFIISILLIVINSIRISWIAFIVKKEKISLLVLSVVISVLFIVNLINSSSNGTHSTILVGFSPVLNQFMKIIMIYGAIYFSILFFTTLFHIPTAEAYDRKAQEVSSLQYFSKLITEVLDFDDLAETITDIAVKVSSAHAAWIVMMKEKEQSALANKNIGYVDANLITKFVFRKKNAENIDDTYFLSLSNLEGKEDLSENYSFAAVAPLRAHNELTGFIILVKKDNPNFDDEDKGALDTFSDYASVAVENSRLLKESIEKERLEKELDVAREIQRKILPAESPEHGFLNISSVFIPAFEVGGDYFDFFDISSDKFGFVIADVSGKGISAAFIMAEIKGIFESLAKTIWSPKQILIKANEILERTLDRKNFVSAAYGLIDLKEEKLYISRAGHCPVLLLRDGRAENLRPSGIGLGLNFTQHFEETLEEMSIELKEGDTIVLYTDGITEAKNSRMEDFGSAHFEKILLKHYKESADDIANKVMKEITLFSKNNSQHDDITLVILKWKQNLNFEGEKEWQNSAPQLKM